MSERHVHTSDCLIRWRDMTEEMASAGGRMDPAYSRAIGQTSIVYLGRDYAWWCTVLRCPVVASVAEAVPWS